MLQIETIVVTPFMQNARIVFCDESKEAVIIDPGGDVELILKKLKETGSTCKEIWLTHSHLDHCGGVKKLLSKISATLIAHPKEAYMRSTIPAVARMYGLPDGEFEECPEPSVFVEGGETLSLGKYKFEVLFTPGHSPGHVSLYNAEENLVIAGDVLFAGSIGRTDLPGGDHDTLLRSVREKLFTLPGETVVLCGHGGDTSIEHEIRSNPFFTNLP